MSARILPFTGAWQGRVEPKPHKGKSQARAETVAIHDARAVREAKGANDDWTARVLLALMETLDRKQLELLEFRLIGPTGLDSESAVQALAIIQLVTGTKAHREAVSRHLDALQAREV